MSHSSTESGPSPASGSTRTKVLRVGFGLILGLEALSMGLAGLTKFLNPVMWTTVFSGFGYPPLLAYFIGGAEVIGVVLLLVPKFSSYAAIGLGVIMVGALHATLTYPNELGWYAPAMHLGALTLIGTVRWRRRLGGDTQR